MTVLVGMKAPDFTVPAVLPDGEIVQQFTLSQAIIGKYGLLFFYPLDFTFVCPSELLALDHRMDAFIHRDVEVIGISIDSHYAHHAWRRTSPEEGGIGPIRFTLAADLNHDVARAYDVESPSGVAFRGAFLIDKHGVVRSQLVNDMPLGRNVDELLRLFDAMQFHERYGQACPEGWQPGEKGMKMSRSGIAQYLKEMVGHL